MQRIIEWEHVEIVQKYDPDKLDYYRADLSIMISPLAQAVEPNKSETVQSIDMANIEMDKSYPIID